MIENVNKSKEPSKGEYVDFHKYIGVGSINIVAINPSNAKLREFGWNIAEDAAEPNYITTFERDGKTTVATRIRFMCQIQDIEGKPVVPMDFWIGPEVMVNKEGTKCQIIDSFIRTAWATKDDVKNHRVPQYSNGPATINSNYKPCHRGEEALLNFIFKYLNITPLQTFDKKVNAFVPTKTPGKLSIDNWKALCEGDVSEIASYIAMQPDNRVKVIFGLKLTEDNKSYQTFLNTVYIGNGARADFNTGEYASARKAIDKFFAEHQNAPYTFLATPIKEWIEKPSEVGDNSGADMPAISESEPEPTLAIEDTDDLPF